MRVRRLKYWDDGGQNLETIYELFNSWDNLLRQYDKAWGKYVAPHVYNQQPHVGFLAIAAKDAGWLPLFDFSVERRKGKGRCDLSLWRADKEIIIEVERVWRSVRVNAQRVKELERCLQKATKDARSVKESRGSPQLAILFMVLCRAEDQYNSVKVLWGRLCEIRKRLDADFCALHVRSNEHRRRTPEKCGRDCLGVAVIGHYRE